MTMNENYRSAFVPHDLKAPLVGASSGPLAGLTCVVKDMYDIAGERTGSGNPTILEHQPVATKNADCIQKLLDAGATITGKTICEEFFYSVTGINAHYGTPVNARAPGRMPGGSSSGSAAAQGAGLCDFSLGSDTGGSVRIPASFNGIYGIRPTHGRIGTAGVRDMAPSFDAVGWFASTPGIFRNVGPVLLDHRRVPAKISRVIVLEDAFEQADTQVADMLRTLLEFMADDLPAVAHARIAPDGFDAWREAMRIEQAYETWQTFGSFVKKHNPSIGPGIRDRIAFAETVTKQMADEAGAVRAKVREHVFQTVAPGTICALPAAPCIAPRIDGSEEEMQSFRVRVMGLTCIASLTGLPQISIPAGTIEGCPIGLSFIGWAGSDEALLDLAVKLARYCGMAG
jgi:amidase